MLPMWVVVKVSLYSLHVPPSVTYGDPQRSHSNLIFSFPFAEKNKRAFPRALLSLSFSLSLPCYIIESLVILTHEDSLALQPSSIFTPLDCSTKENEILMKWGELQAHFWEVAPLAPPLSPSNEMYMYHMSIATNIDVKHVDDSHLNSIRRYIILWWLLSHSERHRRLFHSTRFFTHGENNWHSSLSDHDRRTGARINNFDRISNDEIDEQISTGGLAAGMSNRWKVESMLCCCLYVLDGASSRQRQREEV